MDDEVPVPALPQSANSPSSSRKKPRVKETVVDHTYRDYSQVEVEEEDNEKEGKKKNTTFPEKLHAIVSDPKYNHIICWQPHGRSWKIVDKHLLSTVICPKHFAHAKFESFNRSVNGWGFKRLLSPGPDYKSYYHECFLRGRPEVSRLMCRLVTPGKRLPDKQGEPDFYEISKRFPLPQGPSGAMPYDMNQAMALSPPNPSQAMFTSPPRAEANAYGYPYQQFSPNAQMFGPVPPEQQQMFWPNPVASPYGYYPYQPPMMMPQPGMQAGTPQGYFVIPAYHPAAANHPYFQPMSAMAGAVPNITPMEMAGSASVPAGTGKHYEGLGGVKLAEPPSVKVASAKTDNSKRESPQAKRAAPVKTESPTDDKEKSTQKSTELPAKEESVDEKVLEVKSVAQDNAMITEKKSEAKADAPTAGEAAKDSADDPEEKLAVPKATDADKTAEETGGTKSTEPDTTEEDATDGAKKTEEEGGTTKTAESEGKGKEEGKVDTAEV